MTTLCCNLTIAQNDTRHSYFSDKICLRSHGWVNNYHNRLLRYRCLHESILNAQDTSNFDCCFQCCCYMSQAAKLHVTKLWAMWRDAYYTVTSHITTYSYHRAQISPLTLIAADMLQDYFPHQCIYTYWELQSVEPTTGTKAILTHAEKSMIKCVFVLNGQKLSSVVQQQLQTVYERFSLLAVYFLLFKCHGLYVVATQKQFFLMFH